MDYDVPDSTDWLNTPLQAFADLENALHCQVCKEFYDTPMLTSCSHTFCSKCIRTCLSADGRCPACRATDQASKLRNNWALQEIVAGFQAARPSALAVAKKYQQEALRPGKRKREERDTGEDGGAGRTTRSRSKRIAASQASQASQTEPIEVMDSDEDGDFEPDTEEAEVEPDDGLIACPLGCGKRMKIEAVEPHLDRCEDERKQGANRSKSHTPIARDNGFGLGRETPASNTPHERLAELNYSLMNDTKLSRKLKERGIPNWGARQLMIRRHNEWVNIWNANCDSKHPRTKRELLQELDTWERTQGGRAPTTNGMGSTVMRKDFDGAGWSNRNRDNFSRLIADARRTKGNSGTASKDSTASEEATATNSTPTESVIHENNISSSDGAAVPTSSETLVPASPGEPPSATPYANNDVAISSIRNKIAAANAGQHVEPLSNAVFDHPPADARRPSSTTAHPPRESQGSPCDLPTHMAQATSPSSPNKAVKVPMFTMPQRSVSDIDDATTGDIGGG